MIKFEIKDRETGKTSTYSKEDITLGEAERFYETLEKMDREAEKKNAKSADIRKIERDYFVSLFADQGLTEEDILNNMSTRQYAKVSEDTFREIKGEDEEDSEATSNETGKTEE
ncbi:phage tail assembly chaperone G [Staphylococcus saprophyticus]|uniref:phage tail assembly chaperone G n=1 Tax=Staphylococcus TaxID=1279 RepID=UPI001AEBC772|nr:hypothetical protein [Staphylococcus sp. GDX8P107P-1]MDW3976888.1 hypothetical protein [Staphylococcus saprophyticus]